MLGQNLSTPIYSLQISQFAGHGCIFKSYYENEREITLFDDCYGKVLTKLFPFFSAYSLNIKESGRDEMKRN